MLKQEPENIDALVCYGRIIEKIGDSLEAAKKYYERAIAVPESNHVNAHFYLGVLCEKLKDYERAIKLLKQTLVFDQKHFGACIHLATMLAN